MRDDVLIVGGGLAGLALAQALKHAIPAIPFHIFERDDRAGFRAQGYRIRISGDSLKQLLPPTLFAKFEATAAAVNLGRGHTFDALTGEPDPTATMPGPPPGVTGRSTTPYNVDRTVLRTILLQGLEDHVSFGKKFESYKILDDQSVQVKFADGTVERGAVLIGADGARSGVRKQLMPRFPIIDTEGRSVFGKTNLTDDSVARLPDNFLTGMSIAGVPAPPPPGTSPPVKLLFEAMKFDPAARHLDIGVPADYIYWVLCFRNDVIDASHGDLSQILALSNAQSVALANDLTKDWHPSARVFIETANEASASTIAVFSCTEEGLPQSWAQLRQEHLLAPVTLIGDAAHPMPPVGGVGANSAFQDALDLFKAMKASPGVPTTERNAFAEYEKAMLERVKGAVQRSFMGSTRFFGMRPVSELKEISF